MIDIIINRSSVCMEDDAQNHQLTLSIDDSINFTVLTRQLIEKNYFPLVSRNNEVWVLKLNGYDILAYVTKTKAIYIRFIEAEPTVKSRMEIDNNRMVVFEYFSSPLKRAKCIFDLCDGQKFHIWHEGYMDEYNSYRISRWKEFKWAYELKRTRE